MRASPETKPHGLNCPGRSATVFVQAVSAADLQLAYSRNSDSVINQQHSASQIIPGARSSAILAHFGSSQRMEYVLDRTSMGRSSTHWTYLPVILILP